MTHGNDALTLALLEGQLGCEVLTQIHPSLKQLDNARKHFQKAGKALTAMLMLLGEGVYSVCPEPDQGTPLPYDHEFIPIEGPETRVHAPLPTFPDEPPAILPDHSFPGRVDEVAGVNDITEPEPPEGDAPASHFVADDIPAPKPKRVRKETPGRSHKKKVAP